MVETLVRIASFASPMSLFRRLNFKSEKYIWMRIHVRTIVRILVPSVLFQCSGKFLKGTKKRIDEFELKIKLKVNIIG